MRALMLATALCALAGAAEAQDDAQRPWTGVWQGTLGEAPIRACFGTNSDPDQGSYYYLRHLKLIGLTPGDAPKGKTATPTWSEGLAGDDAKTQAHWSLAAGPGGVLTGAWTGGGKRLPLRLTRVIDTASDAGDPPCGGMSYQKPRLVTPTVSRRPATLDGTAYTRLTAQVGAHFGAAIETFELPATIATAPRINAELARSLPRLGQKDPPGYLDCAMGAAGAFGEDGEFDDKLRPDLITRRWLVTQEDSSSSCGGAHPSAGIAWKVWSLTTGAPVDPWTWFAAGVAQAAKSQDELPTIGAKLQEILVARWPRRDADCKDVADTADGWDVHPTREGLAFWPDLPHVDYACSEDVVVPYRDLAPLLNAKGRAAVESILEDLRGLPPRPERKS